MNKWLLIWLLLVPFALPANGAGVIPPDSLAQKAVRTARKVDRFLLDRQRRQQTDTSYIYKPQEVWLFRTRSDVTQSFLQFRNGNPGSGIDFGMNLKSSPKFRQNIGVGYRGVVLGFGIGIPFRNSDKELALQIYANPAGGEIMYGTINSLKGKMQVGDTSFDIPEGAFVCRYLRLGGYYAFNWQRFSFPAAMSQSFIQRRGAGSPLVTAAFRMVWSDYSPNQGRYAESILWTRSVFVGAGGGYGYNWVPSKHWLLHASATETLGLFGSNRVDLYRQPTRFRMRFLPLLTAGNFAVIYYYKKFYFGVYSTVDFLFIPSRERDGGERLNIGLTRASGHLTVGFRI